MKNKADKIIRLFEVNNNRESNKESEDKFKSIANCITDIKNSILEHKILNNERL